MKMFGKLIINEMYKSFLQKKTILFLIVVVILTSLLGYFAYKENKDISDWRKETKKDIVRLEKELETLKATDKFEENEGSIKQEIELYQFKLDNDIPNQVFTPIRFLFMCSMNITLIIMLYIAAFSADVIASEYSWGTIRQILVKPVKRWKIFLAKYCSMILVSIFTYAFYLLIATIIGYLLFSGNSTSIYDASIEDGGIIKYNMLNSLFWTTLAQIFGLAVVSTITFFVATLTRKSALAIILSFILFFGGAALAELFMDYSWYKYILMPNLTLNAYLPNGWEPYPGATFGFSLAVCLAYAVTFFAAGIFIYNKRDVY